MIALWFNQTARRVRRLIADLQEIFKRTFSSATLSLWNLIVSLIVVSALRVPAPFAEADEEGNLGSLNE
jgi:hypothetical protein